MKAQKVQLYTVRSAAKTGQESTDDLLVLAYYPRRGWEVYLGDYKGRRYVEQLGTSKSASAALTAWTKFLAQLYGKARMLAEDVRTVPLPKQDWAATGWVELDPLAPDSAYFPASRPIERALGFAALNLAAKSVAP